MDIFAMIFAVFMIGLALTATAMIGVYAGGMWGAGAFALLIYALYRTATHQSGPDHMRNRDTLNAFQQPMSDD
ncbi:hypothetical protein [Yoonia sp. I 8.24]|uniref:hypothetical protein n=1 Tax=Yoonia sp. I 8.24 TaxID=1537229 RepID=UPI001EDFFEFC|nr:hypothetical protein [Yoonia sp. I 8.24]MCG3266121.1 hypothetical protein [Yoonia sp. I 8.24]